MKRVRLKERTRQTGTVAVEFSLVAIIFFTVVFGTLELARIEYLFNTMEEVTRRAAIAAANVDYRIASELQKVQSDAVFRTSPGPLALGDPVTANNVTIDYLWLSKANWELEHMSTLPQCPAGNRANCMTNPYGGNCIRFVRARVCASMDAAGNCDRLPYKMVFPFLDLSKMKLPAAETIVPAGSLGATVGSDLCS